MNNWYFDFDNTLYNTTNLRALMLENMAENISMAKNIDKENVLKKLNSMFNRENIYNIFHLCEYFEKRYLLPKGSLSVGVSNVLDNGEKLVYLDVVPVLKKLKKENNLHILTFATGNDNMEFQGKKVAGSGIAKYFDSIIITSKPKSNLDIKYENGIFVDDNPKDLQGLYDAGAKKVIRIKRPENKYSKIELNNKDIEEYTKLDDIFLKEEEKQYDE